MSAGFGSTASIFVSTVNAVVSWLDCEVGFSVLTIYPSLFLSSVLRGENMVLSLCYGLYNCCFMNAVVRSLVSLCEQRCFVLSYRLVRPGPLASMKAKLFFLKGSQNNRRTTFSTCSMS